MRQRFISFIGLGSTSALLLIAALGLAGVEVPFGAWAASSLGLMAVLSLELRAMWRPAPRK